MTKEKYFGYSTRLKLAAVFFCHTGLLRNHYILHGMIKFLFGPIKTKNINIIVLIYDKHEKQQTL